jgi:hypothetical protein
MTQIKTQTVSGTQPAITRDDQSVILNWEAEAKTDDGRNETVHVRMWATDDENRPAEIYQFFGEITTPDLGRRGDFNSPRGVSVFEGDIAKWQLPDPSEPVDVGLRVGMLLSEEHSRDQAVTDVGNINFVKSGT